jgi:hypothetical protein
VGTAMRLCPNCDSDFSSDWNMCLDPQGQAAH